MSDNKSGDYDFQADWRCERNFSGSLRITDDEITRNLIRERITFGLLEGAVEKIYRALSNTFSRRSTGEGD